MKYISSYKIFESIDFYTKINQSEFDHLLTNPNLYSFPDKYIKELEQFGKVETVDASIYSSMSSIWPNPSKDIWLMSDDWGLDKSIDSDYIVVHGENTIKYFLKDFGEPDQVLIKNFSVRINISGINIEMTMCADEWFLVYANDIWDFMYKCDQFSGVIRLINDFGEIKKGITNTP
jgi:hypothetical protein